MSPIITDRNAAEKKGMLADGRYFVKAQTGEAMYLPIWYGHRLDLDKMIITESREEIEKRTDLPDLNELVKKGYVLEATIFREHEVFCGFVRSFGPKRIAKVLAEFREHGFDVTEEALLYCYEAWKHDFKSGFRDEAHGYHLFTPCGCNPLTFRASSLEKGLDWQKTYKC